MSDISDGMNFEAFLEETNLREALHERVELTHNRFQLYLSERGVIFDPADFVELSGVGTEPTDRNELQRMADQNYHHARSLATTKIKVELATEAGVEPPLIKKHLQAQEVASGATKVWIDLINAEFPGEPLQDNDYDLLLAEVIDGSDGKILSDAELAHAIDELTGFLTSLGVTEPTDAERTATLDIGFLFSILTHASSEGARVSTREDAQLYAVRLGLDMNIWSQVIQHFFGSE